MTNNTPTISVGENRTLTITTSMPEAKLEAYDTSAESNESFLTRMSNVLIGAIAARREHCYKQLLAHISEISYDGYAIRWKGGHFSPNSF